jgi:hexokinase
MQKSHQRKPPSRKGSLALVGRDLLDQIHSMEQLFTVTPEKLRQITQHFGQELDKGLSIGGGSIPMLPTWVLGFADGSETGSYLALDMGLRI